MEFSVFVQMRLDGQRAHDPDAEHDACILDQQIVSAADKHNFKYAWVSEHHALTEYSHLSASESFIPYMLAKTDRIHIGSGIWPLNPAQNHPIRLAERAAMCDHLSEGRFEFGTGRGAGSHEIGTFEVPTSVTKETWEEVIWEFKKMWESPFYSHEGKAFSAPTRNVLPKPYGGGSTHPPIWVAAGNTPTYANAARHGIGVLGFTVAAIPEMEPLVRSYKDAVSEATPVGQFVNDNVMITSGMICAPTAKEAREIAYEAKDANNYYMSLLFLYHDTFPVPPGMVRWPEVLPNPAKQDVDAAIDTGFLLCGSPGHLIDQLRRFDYVPFDQLGFGMPHGQTREQILQSIQLFGDEVIPEFDKDPIHRSTRMRYGDLAPSKVTSR